MDNNKRQAADIAKTLLVLTLASLVIFLLNKKELWLYIAILLASIGAFSGWLSRVIDRLWMGLAKLLGKVVPVFLLGVVFFGVLTPLSWLYRWLGKQKNPLMLRDPGTSTFVDMNREFPKESFSKTW